MRWRTLINIEDDCRPSNVNYYPPLASIEMEMEHIITCNDEDNNIIDDGDDDDDNDQEMRIPFLQHWLAMINDDDSGFHSIDDDDVDDNVFYN
ncbi:hypothetical protein PV325_011633 [Microctonus aethiopoides]|nr:hypothetical protein PV325_011633 [Microctonus aethiopoides]